MTPPRRSPPRLRRPRQGLDPLSLRGRVQRFLAREVWELDLGGLSRLQRAGYRVMRIAYLAGSGFRRDHCLVRASALTYITVLSLVPLLAFAFSVLRGLGYYQELLDTRIRPYLDRLFAGGGGDLRQAIDQLLDFVNTTRIQELGVVGLVVVVWAVLRMLGTVEAALNDIWRVQRPRTLLRKLSDYLAMVIVAPIFLVFAGGMTTIAQSQKVQEFVVGTLHLGSLISVLLSLTPSFVGILAFGFVYLALPNARIRYSSAIIGGVLAGLLWHLALVLQIGFQLGIARYNALYSGFAAIPIFLVWVQLSWVILLLGAEVAYAHQNEHAHQRAATFQERSQAIDEGIGLRAVARIAGAFLAGERQPSTDELSLELGVPQGPLEDVLYRLEQAGLLAAIDPVEEGRHVPARDPSRVRVQELLDALRGGRAAGRFSARTPLDREVQRLLEGFQRDLAGSAWNVTLADLARRGLRDEAPEAVAEPRLAPEP